MVDSRTRSHARENTLFTAGAELALTRRCRGTEHNQDSAGGGRKTTMQTKHILAAVGVLSSLTITGFASAQEAEPEAGAEAAPAASTRGASAAIATTSSEAAAPNEAAATPGHATGMMIQARVQAQSSLLSIGGTGFLVGYQAPSFALGLGLGLTRVGVSSGGQSGNVMLFQVAPTAIIDVWHSSDGRARANIIGSVGYARASLTASGSTSEECTGGSNTPTTCTTSTSSGTASASLIPVSLGFGGDYFLGRNFALGAEFGVQAMFLAGASVSQSGGSSSIDAGGDLEMAYGALRATFVLGD